MVQKIGYYINLDKNVIAAQMVARYGEFLQDMPLEAQLTFRAALATFQVAQHQWHSSPNPPTRRRMIDAAIEAVNPEAWQSEQLTDWMIAFATDPEEDWRIEAMIRALSDSIACA